MGVAVLVTTFCAKTAAQTTFADSSVLATGKWAKIKVMQSGMQRIPNSMLQGMGFTDPAKVTVWGAGSAARPEYNSSPRIDDLRPLPIIRQRAGLVFFAENATVWNYDVAAGFYMASANANDPYGYVFLTDSKPDNPIAEASPISAESSYVVDTYDYREHFEERLENIQNTGREWFGQRITTNTNNTISHTFAPPAYCGDGPVGIRARFCVNAASEAAWKLEFNGNEIANGTASPTRNSDEDYGSLCVATKSVEPTGISSGEAQVKLTVDMVNGDISWLDYFTLNWPAKLAFDGKSQLLFRSNRSYINNRNKYSEVRIAGAPATCQVWDVSDPTAPVRQNTYTDASGNLAFLQRDNVLREYVVFNPDAVDFAVPEFAESVPCQNLHATGPTNYIIVYHPDFKDQAERLANIHRSVSGLDVVTVSTSQIFNEFGGGQRDPVAIRDFVRMVYQRDPNRLRYLLLFGSGNIDNYTYGDANIYNKVPVYHSQNSLNHTLSYPTDDFFGWLEDNESTSDTRSNVDIGVGRIPCWTESQAAVYVDKVEHYLTKSVWGEWQQQVVMAADDGDENEHLGYADKGAADIEDNFPNIKVRRIFMEAYPSVRATTGIAYPTAISEFREAVINSGSLVVHYVGHGSTQRLSAEGFFYTRDISLYTNLDHMPLWVGATCDFSAFDHQPINGSSDLIFYPFGGAIGVISTVRVVYGDSSYRLTNYFHKRAYGKDEDGRRYSIGDALKYAKRNTSTLVNSLKYHLIGDPAIVLRCNNGLAIQTDSVCGEDYASHTTPVMALSPSLITASVRDSVGNIAKDFNGTAVVSVYDKRRTRSTLGAVSKVCNYEEWGGRLYNGTAEVKNGLLQLTLTLPKDIDFELGYGKISYAALSEDGREGAGSDETLLVGGISSSAANDDQCPTLTAYLDHPAFKSGDTVGPSPTLTAFVSDASGVNNSGAGVGHDIQLILDNDRANSITLNNFFKYDPGSYTQGSLTYQLNDISAGNHTLTLKVWDNQNNSTTVSMDFVVKDRGDIIFGRKSVYPSAVQAWADSSLMVEFTHSSAGQELEVTINAFGLNGKLLATGKQTISTGNSSSGAIDAYAVAPALRGLPPGVYLMQVKVRNANGQTGSFAQRFVVM